MDRAFDVAVVGSGSAATQAAFSLRAGGRSVAVIDERPFGGTCALRGCDPKKVLVHAARVVDETQRLAQHGILRAPAAIDWAALVRFKRTFTDPVPAERLREYQKKGIVCLHGRARFEDPRTLLAGDDRIRAEHFVIAAGAQESHVAQGDTALLTSEQFLELDELPQSLLFVGGGYIAFEFAHVAARAGARVTILHNDAHPLGGFDQDLVERVLDVTRSIGIEVVLDAPVSRVEKNASGVVAHVKQGDSERTFTASAGVLAAGRKPNIDGLALETGGIERTKKGVNVNDYMQSVSNPLVYAAGDCADAGSLPLTPVASYTGEVAAQNILHGNNRKPDFRGLATMVYTIPPLGTVGLTQAQARERGIEIDVHAGDMTDWYSTRHVAGRSAFYKIVRAKNTGRILGASIFGPQAQEQINVLALAIRQEVPTDALNAVLFAYPTGSSDLEFF